MTAESKHHLSGGLSLAVALAASAGFVDAFVFVRVTPVFVANMSGNLVRLGIAAGARDGWAVAAALVALVGFLAGAVIATSHLDSHVRKDRPPTAVPLLTLESMLLVVLFAVVRGANITISSSIDVRDCGVVLIGATAMGIQAVALRSVGEIAVSTTYGTGAVVRLGEKLALAARRAERPGDVRRRTTIVILGIVLISYVFGAWLATSIGTSPNVLLIPAAVPLVAAVLIRARPNVITFDDDAVTPRR